MVARQGQQAERQVAQWAVGRDIERAIRGSLEGSEQSVGEQSEIVGRRCRPSCQRPMNTRDGTQDRLGGAERCHPETMLAQGPADQVAVGQKVLHQLTSL